MDTTIIKNLIEATMLSLQEGRNAKLSKKKRETKKRKRVEAQRAEAAKKAAIITQRQNRYAFETRMLNDPEFFNQKTAERQQFVDNTLKLKKEYEDREHDTANKEEKPKKRRATEEQYRELETRKTRVPDWHGGISSLLRAHLTGDGTKLHGSILYPDTFEVTIPLGEPDLELQKKRGVTLTPEPKVIVPGISRSFGIFDHGQLHTIASGLSAKLPALQLPKVIPAIKDKSGKELVPVKTVIETTPFTKTNVKLEDLSLDELTTLQSFNSHFGVLHQRFREKKATENEFLNGFENLAHDFFIRKDPPSPKLLGSIFRHLGNREGIAEAIKEKRESVVKPEPQKSSLELHREREEKSKNPYVQRSKGGTLTPEQERKVAERHLEVFKYHHAKQLREHFRASKPPVIDLFHAISRDEEEASVDPTRHAAPFVDSYIKSNPILDKIPLMRGHLTDALVSHIKEEGARQLAAKQKGTSEETPSSKTEALTLVQRINKYLVESQKKNLGVTVTSAKVPLGTYDKQKTELLYRAAEHLGKGGAIPKEHLDSLFELAHRAEPGAVSALRDAVAAQSKPQKQERIPEVPIGTVESIVPKSIPGDYFPSVYRLNEKTGLIHRIEPKEVEASTPHSLSSVLGHVSPVVDFLFRKLSRRVKESEEGPPKASFSSEEQSLADTLRAGGSLSHLAQDALIKNEMGRLNSSETTGLHVPTEHEVREFESSPLYADLTKKGMPPEDVLKQARHGFIARTRINERLRGEGRSRALPEDTLSSPKPHVIDILRRGSAEIADLIVGNDKAKDIFLDHINLAKQVHTARMEKELADFSKQHGLLRVHALPFIEPKYFSKEGHPIHRELADVPGVDREHLVLDTDDKLTAYYGKPLHIRTGEHAVNIASHLFNTAFNAVYRKFYKGPEGVDFISKHADIAGFRESIRTKDPKKYKRLQGIEDFMFQGIQSPYILKQDNGKPIIQEGKTVLDPKHKNKVVKRLEAIGKSRIKTTSTLLSGKTIPEMEEAAHAHHLVRLNSEEKALKSLLGLP